MHQKLEFEEVALTPLSARLADFQTRVRSLEEGCKEGGNVAKTKVGNPGIKIDSRFMAYARDQGALGQTHQHPRSECVVWTGQAAFQSQTQTNTTATDGEDVAGTGRENQPVSGNA